MKPTKLKPAASYLHSAEKRVQITPKIHPALKAKCEELAEVFSTEDHRVSLNSFIESALRWYCDALDREIGRKS